MPLPHVDPIPLPETITVQRWADPIVEKLGYPMDSDYVETFWLPTLGPTALLLARRLALMVGVERPPVAVPTIPLAEALGLAPRLLVNDALPRSVTRLRVFGVVDHDPNRDVLRVRTHLAPLNRAQTKRLPAHLAALLEAVPA